MRHEITMPQLGMTQDSGVIVSWGKRPGDSVKADDILMEVETDKSTMEVEVGHDGFLAEVRAESGATVPVGDVVAVISDSADDIVSEKVSNKPKEETAEPASQETIATEKTDVAAPSEPTTRTPEKTVRPSPAKASTDNRDGRIYASPKAKMEAHRRGIDLARLARQGAPQPFHVADLEKLAPQSQAGGGTLSALAATVERAAFDNFCVWAAEASDGTATTAAIWSAFASACWRGGPGLDAEGPLIARVQTLVPIPASSTFSDADRSGLGRIAPLADDAAVDLVILDLTGSGLTDYRSGGSVVPTFTVAEDGDLLRITLGFDEADLPVEKAAAVLAGVAGRVKEPLRHCL